MILLRTQLRHCYTAIVQYTYDLLSSRWRALSLARSSLGSVARRSLGRSAGVQSNWNTSGNTKTNTNANTFTNTNINTITNTTTDISTNTDRWCNRGADRANGEWRLTSSQGSASHCNMTQFTCLGTQIQNCGLFDYKCTMISFHCSKQSDV